MSSTAKHGAMVVVISKSGHSYTAMCGSLSYLLADCDNDDVAVGKIVRSDWMTALFGKYGRLRIVCEF